MMEGSSEDDLEREKHEVFIFFRENSPLSYYMIYFERVMVRLTLSAKGIFFPNLKKGCLLRISLEVDFLKIRSSHGHRVFRRLHFDDLLEFDI